jgi:hypothetical protein
MAQSVSRFSQATKASPVELGDLGATINKFATTATQVKVFGMRVPVNPPGAFP